MLTQRVKFSMYNNQKRAWLAIHEHSYGEHEQALYEEKIAKFFAQYPFLGSPSKSPPNIDDDPEVIEQPINTKQDY